jgi:hypothetical protein
LPSYAAWDLVVFVLNALAFVLRVRVVAAQRNELLEMRSTYEIGDDASTRSRHSSTSQK